ncbi:hypothetical protein ES707_16699 [subsurface metagenome]
MKRVLLTLTVILLLAASSHSKAQYEKFVYKPKRDTEGHFQAFLRVVSQRPFHGSYAMVVAIGDYDNLLPLKSPPRDAEKIRDFLLSSNEYDEVVILKEDDANFGNIRYFMRTYFTDKMSKKGRYRFLFYFSGHGTQHKGWGNTVMGYLQLKGATGKPGDSDVIDMSQIGNWAAGFRYATHMLFLLDCCFSGLAGVERKNYDTEVDPLELAKENGWHMITAGTQDETSIGDLEKWGGSLFTDVVLKGIKGHGTADSNSDGIVTTYELFNYVQPAVRNEAKRSGFPQNPLISNLGKYTDIGQYFFVYQDPRVGRVNEEGWEDVISTKTVVESELVDYVLISSSVVSRGDILRIKVRTHSSRVRVFGIFRDSMGQPVRVDAKYDRKEGGIYIAYLIPENAVINLHTARIFVQEIGSAKEDQLLVEYEVVE